MTKEIGFIGLGVMGFHMASHLLKQKKIIHIIDRESLNTKKFIKRYKNTGLLKSYKNLYELAKNVHLILSCVGNDKDLKNVYLSKMEFLLALNQKPQSLITLQLLLKFQNIYINNFSKNDHFFLTLP